MWRRQKRHRKVTRHVQSGLRADVIVFHRIIYEVIWHWSLVQKAFPDCQFIQKKMKKFGLFTQSFLEVSAFKRFRICVGCVISISYFIFFFVKKLMIVNTVNLTFSTKWVRNNTKQFIEVLKWRIIYNFASNELTLCIAVFEIFIFAHTNSSIFKYFKSNLPANIFIFLVLPVKTKKTTFHHYQTGHRVFPRENRKPRPKNNNVFPVFFHACCRFWKPQKCTVIIWFTTASLERFANNSCLQIWLDSVRFIRN